METYLLLLSITSGRDKVKREWEALRGMWDWDFFFHHALPTQPNMSFSVRNLVSFCRFLPVRRNHNHCITTYSACKVLRFHKCNFLFQTVKI